MPKIVCAAIRYNIDGVERIIPCVRHHDAITAGLVIALGLPRRGEQGFLDQYGKFYDRTAAWVVAESNGQIIRRVGGDTHIVDGVVVGRLFSENLY